MVGKNTDTQNTGAPPVVSVHDMDTIYYVMASARKRLLQLKVATASADPHPPK
jgi:hypothetical protein